MSTHDKIELPPLPKASKMYDIPGYDEEELKDYARAAIEADRNRRCEPVGYVMPTAIKQLKAGGNAIVGGVSQGGDVAVYLAPQPAEPVKSTCKKCNGTGVESTRFHGVWPNGEECLEPIKCDQCDGFGMTSAAGPVKSHLKVSYDDKGDCLYVVCDSNEPADAEEDDKGILYRRAISDGRLIGITVMNFVGPHAKSSDDTPQPAEPDAPAVSDYEAAMADHRRLVRELDVLLNGDGAAEQASLCDIVAQVRREGIKTAEPVKVPSMIDLIADDAYATAFQSVGQYRKALLARYGKGAP